MVSWCWAVSVPDSQVMGGWARRVKPGPVESRSVAASYGNHLHGRRGRGFDAARWDPVCLGKAWQVPVSLGPSRKPPSCWHGGRSTRPWWDYFGGAGFVTAGSVSARKGMFRWVWLCRVPVWHGQPRKPHPCRHGSRSTREVWDVLRFGKASCVSLRCVGPWPGMVRQVRSSPGAEGFVMETKLVQARCRINAGGLGCIKSGLVWARYVMVGRCLVGFRAFCWGLVCSAHVIGTAPLRRGRAEWKGGQHGR